MIDQKQMTELACGIIYVVGQETVPNSYLWMAIEKSPKTPQEFDLMEYMALLAVLKMKGILTEKFDCLQLTAKGLEIYGRLVNGMSRREPAKPRQRMPSDVTNN